MRVMICSFKQRRQWLLLLTCIGIGALFLWLPQAAANGVRRGLAVCGQMLIPSLFPFMVLSGFIIRSGLAHGIGRRLDPLMKAVFGFSGNAAAAILISMLGGYPAGALAVAQLTEQGDIDTAAAKRLLCCCVNAGPAFVIGGVGVGILGSAKAGVLLLVAHLLSSLLVSLTLRQRYTPTPCVRTPAVGVGTAVTQSVHAATEALLSMCGFVLLASAALSLADALGGAAHIHAIWRCGFSCVLEVSTGCIEAASMGAATPFWLGAALGFAGLAVHGQIAAITASHALITTAFFRTRLLHALAGGCLSYLLFRVFPPFTDAVPTAAMLSSVTQQTDATAAMALAALMVLCVLFLHTLPRSQKL